MACGDHIIRMLFVFSLIDAIEPPIGMVLASAKVHRLQWVTCHCQFAHRSAKVSPVISTKQKKGTQPTCRKDDVHDDYSARLLQAHHIFSNSLCEHGKEIA